MAKRRKQKHQIDKKIIIEAFAEMAKNKNIDRDLLQGVLEDTLSMIVPLPTFTQSMSSATKTS